MKIRTRDDDIRKWLRVREMGGKATLGIRNRLNKQLYSSVIKVRSWNPVDTVDQTHHGGIFNFDFSKDGSLLVAACAKRSILVFDPLNGKLIFNRDKAHSDCVNCIKFLDSRLFATCSDDMTVCMWDVRYLKQKIRTLKGHTNWVKNIEYDSSSELLVTSGFDGNIYTWDINRYSEREEDFRCVFHTTGLMRTKMTPDATKLITATASGYLMVIHDLDLHTLAHDLQGFKPHLYHRMQMSQSMLNQENLHSHVFNRRRNRVELISDFPPENKAEMIASLEVHPQGWSVVSRNTSCSETSEWTCVHDIQSFNDESDNLEDNPDDRSSSMEDAAGPSSWTSHSSQGNKEEPRTPAASSSSCSSARAPSLQSSSGHSQTSSPAFFLSIKLNNSSNQQVTQSESEREDIQSQSYQLEVLAERSFISPTDSLSSHPSVFDLTSMFPQPSGSSAVPGGVASAAAEVQTSVENLSASSLQERERETSGAAVQNAVSSGQPADHRQLPETNHEKACVQSGQTQAESDLHRTDNSAFQNEPTESDSRRRRRHSGIFSRPFSPQISGDYSHSTPQSAPAVFRIQKTSHSPADLVDTETPRRVPDSPVHRHYPQPLTIAHSASPSPPSPMAGMCLGDYVSLVFRSDAPVSGSMWLVGPNKPAERKAHVSTTHQRLTHYVEELNVSRGFIKEVSFSNDGRLICSPFGFGVRLLAFDPSCSEVCDVVPSSPVKLYELTSNMTHTSAVVTTKFSPLHCLLVSGCLNGKVDFHQPLL